MEFAKLHALGNDFLVADVSGEEGHKRSLGALARRICHRHCGVGADGVLFFQPAIGDPAADFSTLIFNADGSKAEMSGNGVRCLAAFLYRGGKSPSRSLRIRTVAGVKLVTLLGEEGTTYTFESSLGLPITAPDHIPVRIPSKMDPILDYAVTTGSHTVPVTITSMGNPHCSTFWPSLDEAPIDTLGPLLENESLFPNRTNVEFIQVLDRHRIRVRFWERGVGRTLASGTGSCAGAVAAILNRRAGRRVTDETEMGWRLGRWERGSEVVLIGPAQFICAGTYVAPES